MDRWSIVEWSYAKADQWGLVGHYSSGGGQRQRPWGSVRKTINGEFNTYVTIDNVKRPEYDIF